MSYMFTLSEAASAVNGRIINSGNTNVEIMRVSKDTRTVGSGDLYVAIKGERFDGHAFCADAFEKGAVAVLVSDSSAVPASVPAIVVNDTVEAMGLLARHYRFKMNARVICVTGSVGKTSTREMICAALSSKKVFSTKRNENNEIGMPMTILDAPMDTEVLVLEMGMRLRGEISYLTNIACPDIAVITNAGFCHIERLGSREEILLAKSEILEGLVDGGVIIVNGDDEVLYNHIRNVTPAGKFVAAVFASRETSDLVNLSRHMSASSISFNGSSMSFDINCGASAMNSVTLNLNGIHNVRNALIASMCASIVGVSESDLRMGLLSYEQMAGRGAVTVTPLYTVINDAYNAAPESMEAAFANLNILCPATAAPSSEAIAVLGGILELGDFAPSLHEYVGSMCGQYNFAHVLVTGDNRADFVRGFMAAGGSEETLTVCSSNEEVEAALEGIVSSRVAAGFKSDVILFKASNAFGFEKLAKKYIALGEEA